MVGLLSCQVFLTEILPFAFATYVRLVPPQVLERALNLLPVDRRRHQAAARTSPKTVRSASIASAMVIT
jgi:hypothetical protein